LPLTSISEGSLLELATADRRDRGHPRDSGAALGGTFHSAPILQRHVLIADELRHPIYYSIAEDTGVAGMDSG
jgi:hypothetical protein